MPKEKVEKTETKTVKQSEKYFITENVQKVGYPGGKIDNKIFTVIKAKFGEIPSGASIKIGVTEPAKCFVGDPLSEKDNHVQTGGEYFEDLTLMQKHQLYIAGVIKLNLDQMEVYKKEVATLRKPKE